MRWQLSNVPRHLVARAVIGNPRQPDEQNDRNQTQNADLQALNILAPLGHRVASTCQGIGSRFLERIHSGL